MYESTSTSLLIYLDVNASLARIARLQQPPCTTDTRGSCLTTKVISCLHSSNSAACTAATCYAWLAHATPCRKSLVTLSNTESAAHSMVLQRRQRQRHSRLPTIPCQAVLFCTHAHSDALRSSFSFLSPAASSVLTTCCTASRRAAAALRPSRVACSSGRASGSAAAMAASICSSSDNRSDQLQCIPSDWLAQVNVNKQVVASEPGSSTDYTE